MFTAKKRSKFPDVEDAVLHGRQLAERNKLCDRKQKDMSSVFRGERAFIAAVGQLFFITADLTTGTIAAFCSPVTGQVSSG
jgi:hypothetical protein